MSIKVLVVDDDIIVCESMKIILSLDKDIDVVGTCSNGDDAFSFCQNNNVDVVLMDIRMPICNGVVGTKKIKDAFSKIKVIILTTFNEDEYIIKALKNGASGYLLKTVSPDKLIDDIKIVYKGNMLIDENAANTVTKMLSEEEENIQFEKYNLTESEINIIKLISEGFSNKEISEKLYLTEGTVKNKISKILLKLRLRDRTQIAIFYLKNGAFNMD
ncbi:response regulator transcription factor [Clostridium sediminicola]|uniref:response regulator transcription factor n=1 Tax=Clostridium sediminicola TaxID=3114879 RepID=UPI0031F1C8E2